MGITVSRRVGSNSEWGSGGSGTEVQWCVAKRIQKRKTIKDTIKGKTTDLFDRSLGPILARARELECPGKRAGKKGHGNCRFEVVLLVCHFFPTRQRSCFQWGQAPVGLRPIHPGSTRSHPAIFTRDTARKRDIGSRPNLSVAVAAGTDGHRYWLQQQPVLLALDQLNGGQLAPGGGSN